MLAQFMECFSDYKLIGGILIIKAAVLVFFVSRRKTLPIPVVSQKKSLGTFCQLCSEHADVKHHFRNVDGVLIGVWHCSSCKPPDDIHTPTDPPICEKCNLTSEQEITVRLRHDCKKVYCNDCHARATGRHTSQILKMNELGFWIGWDMDELKKSVGGITNPISLRIVGNDSTTVNLYKCGNGKEVLVLESIPRPIFIFHKHPSQVNAEFICEMYKLFGHWPAKKPEPEPKLAPQTNSIGHMEDCWCPVCR